MAQMRRPLAGMWTADARAWGMTSASLRLRRFPTRRRPRLPLRHAVTRPVSLLGVLAVALLALRVWRNGSDPPAASVATVLVAGVVVGHALWGRPGPGAASALILTLLAAGLLL